MYSYILCYSSILSLTSRISARLVYIINTFSVFQVNSLQCWIRSNPIASHC
nr:MAG TPA: hypothetical protein [Bacteriophage sp.]